MTNDGKWWRMIVNDGEWWRIMMVIYCSYNGQWWFVMVSNGSWLLLVVHSGQWWLRVSNDGQRWCMDSSPQESHIDIHIFSTLKFRTKRGDCRYPLSVFLSVPTNLWLWDMYPHVGWCPNCWLAPHSLLIIVISILLVDRWITVKKGWSDAYQHLANTQELHNL